MNDVILDRFCDLILEQTGLCIREKDRGSLQKNIETRMKALQIERPERYFDALSHSENTLNDHRLVFSEGDREREWKTFVQLLTTGESYFFRDLQQLELLSQTLLPSIIRRKRQERDPQHPGKLTLKLWSAGCSSGEETYSLAILVTQLIPDLRNWDIFILGTDINQSYLELARSGLYREWSFRQVHQDIKRQYFTLRGKEYELSPAIRQMVTFRHGNLIRDAFPNVSANVFDMDVIICRNVFIYFDELGIASVLQKFHDTLSSTGYLLSGHAELQGQNLSQFVVQSLPGSVVYQKKSDATEQLAGSAVRALQPESLQTDIHVQGWYAEELRKQRQATDIKLDVPSPLPAETAASSLSIASPVSDASTRPDDDVTRMRTCVEREDYDRALTIALEIERSQPTCIEASLAIAQIYANRGDAADARKQCQRVLDIEPLSPEAWHLLAQIADEDGERSLAKKYLKKIIYINPQWVSAYLDLGAIYEQEGDRERSRKMYAAAMDILESLPPDEAIASRKSTTASALLAYLRKVYSRE